MVLSVESSKPLIYCRIVLPNGKVLVPSPNWTKLPGFSYYGKGLEAGHCGVRIQHTEIEYNGLVHFSMGIDGEEVTQTYRLLVTGTALRRTISYLSPPL